MGQVDVGAVQRHLAAAGHHLSAPAVASLLADLGFPVGTEGAPTSTYDLKITASMRHPEKEERLRAQTPSPWRERTPTTAAHPGVSKLLAKLDELERQLAAVSISQDRLEGAGEARNDGGDEAKDSHRWGAHPAPSPHRHLLGSEAQQLRDWAQGRWPAVAAPPPERKDEAVDRRHRRGSRPTSRRTDPVARYRQLQRVWARDPFLRSGGAFRASRRREEGFRDAFAALHSGSAGSTGSAKA